MKRNIFLLILVITAATAGAQPNVERLKQRVDVYLDSVARQPDWLLARLQMYWTTHAPDVFINGENFDHVGGERAARPTVKFNGCRGTASAYNLPRLEDVVPYDDDANGSVTYVNKLTGQKEKTHPSKTGTNIDLQNRKVLGIARDAALLFEATADGRYADLAAGVFDTYMQGIYYRNIPTDMGRGHQQTLVGLTTFEVIHEEAVPLLADIYRVLRNDRRLAANTPLYDAALKKWADNIISNGVPHNNWNLYQAEFVAHIALVLDHDKAYADGHGREYYLDQIVNQSSVRQWSLSRLAQFGFDPATAVWYESPGYSCGVINDYADFANRLDRDAQIDVFAQLPIIGRSIFASAQYLMPNRMICGFGDTHPNYLNMKAVDAMMSYAKRHQNQALLDSLEAFRKAVQPSAPDEAVGRYVSPTFYAPNVSWLIQRTGMNPQRDLCISLNGSLGNHQHANGIAMELYGKGYVLGPDAGIGHVLYGGADYQEYYSRFPAHNTVCVDGVSDYPVMMSQHAFKKQFVADNQSGTCSQVYFLEPETQADQLRTNGIVKTKNGGYYVDIFRSRRQDGNDRFHDYFYHNMGQHMTLTQADGSALSLQPTDELAFAGGHLYAYSYIYDKKSTVTANDVKATFTTDCPDGRRIDMTMWMQGSADREVFRALSPVNREYERLGSFMPYNVVEQPVLTYVARQRGNAWEKPFVAVFEPSASDAPSDIKRVSFFKPESQSDSAVGICVELTDGTTDYIFSTPETTKMKYQGMKVNARYAVVRNGKTIISQ